MRKKVRHLLGISGGKDSAALAIYMKTHYPEMDMEYYFCDTGKELSDTYELIDELEAFLGKKITRLQAAKNSPEKPFDHFLRLYKGYLPSSQSRWCTKKLKLDPFEEYVKDDIVVSYVAIRGDENREGYVSTKSNIQTVFPFRKNIWSIEILNYVLNNDNVLRLLDIYEKVAAESVFNKVKETVLTNIPPKFHFTKKINSLLEIDTVLFNKVVFEFLKGSKYPVGMLNDFPLIENKDVIVKEDVIRIFNEYGVTFPKYYREIEYEVNGKKGKYSRSRSGCFFCFYQQKIEWVWLYEQHPDLFKQAMEYEKDGYTWNENESLADIIKPERIQQIKEDHLKKSNNKPLVKTNKLIDILDGEEGISCVNCFI